MVTSNGVVPPYDHSSASILGRVFIEFRFSRCQGMSYIVLVRDATNPYIPTDVDRSIQRNKDGVATWSFKFLHPWD